MAKGFWILSTRLDNGQIMEMESQTEKPSEKKARDSMFTGQSRFLWNKCTCKVRVRFIY